MGAVEGGVVLVVTTEGINVLFEESISVEFPCSTTEEVKFSEVEDEVKFCTLSLSSLSESFSSVSFFSTASGRSIFGVGVIALFGKTRKWNHEY
jgi:hypothetical protein